MKLPPTMTHVLVWIVLALPLGYSSRQPVSDTDTDASVVEDLGADLPSPCAAQQAASNGDDCNISVGVAWNGRICARIWCGCVGADCDQIFAHEEACVARYASCMPLCPLGPLGAKDDTCRCGDLQYWHCCPDGTDFCSCSAFEDGRRLMCGETEPRD